MRYINRLIIPFCFAFFASCASVWAGTAPAAATAGLGSTSEPQQMEDFNLSGYGQNGEKTWEVQGASMDMAGQEIKIRDITAHMYGKQENLVVTADNGHFDKESGVVRLTDNVKAVTDGGVKLNTTQLDWSQKDQKISSDQKVRVTKDNMSAEGTGIVAHQDTKVATFEKDVVLTIDEQKKAGQAKAPAQVQPFGGAGKLTITCDGPMELNYEKQTAVFNKNVHVEPENGEGEMIADLMTVRFDQATRQIATITADGHVQIKRSDNTSYSEGAVFDNATKKVTLTGRPKLVLYTDMSPKKETAPETKHVSP